MNTFDYKWDDYFWTGLLYIPFLDTETKISVVCDTSPEQTEPTPRQLALVNALLSLPASLVNEMDDAAEKWRACVDDAVDLSEYDLGHINRQNIREHYQVQAIYIPPIGDCQDDYQFITSECDWEEEHGMQLLLKNGKFVSFGEQDGSFLNRNWIPHILYNV
jgi:hypothetical protein